MSVECPACDGSGEIDAGEASWSTPPAQGGPSTDGENYRVQWHPSSGTVKRALFRVATADRVATLLHVRTILVRQRGGESTCIVDPEATLDDVPDALLTQMRADGYRPAERTVVV
ncbi:hypothetical protein ACFQJD_00215 [Haloplanus sp. GCM10025708]|uniref:hypothetical protein n=1 Tax=Haloplanus sp. GCM10025708 TaxID=3252679 RepID=UPI00361B6712